MLQFASPLTILAGSIFLFGLCAIEAAVLFKRTLSFVYPLTLFAAALALLGDLAVLLSAESDTAKLSLGLPGIGLNFRLDPLSAFFGLVVNLGILTSSIYGLGLGKHGELSPRIEPFFPAFAAAMNLVLLADDAFNFLFSWELMSVTSWILVLSRHEDAESRRAAHIYITMASIGTVALLFAFGGMAGTAGSYTFQSIRAANLDPVVAGLVLSATLIGTGSKAGIIPLHAWLPLAHPAAPSHVSAMMSGVMTKVAVYGLIRILFDLLGNVGYLASVLILVLGAVSALIGVLYALMQHDLKRLLAYHTVENIGIIFIGLGLALAFKANNTLEASALAMTAALFHVLNHSMFKSLLFLGSGAILHATKKRDLEEMGGLIHRMPATGLTFLIGCLAISALPPLNGFVSEWLTFQAILLSPSLPLLEMKILMPMIGASLALAAALAAACFVKVYGISFLGRPRTQEVADAKEADIYARISMFVLAGFCLLTGVFPGFVIDALASVNQTLLATSIPSQSGNAWLSIIPVTESRSSYNGMLILAFMVSTAGMTALIIHRIASDKLRKAPVWDCGSPNADPVTQYTASSFAQPIRRVYGSVFFRATESVKMPPPGDNTPARFDLSLRDFIWDYLYERPVQYLLRLSDYLNIIQFLSVRRYIIFMFAALIILLVTITVRT